MQEAHDELHNGKEMSFFDHLEELRWRLFRVAAILMAFAVIAFVFKDFIFDQVIFGPTHSNFISYEVWCAFIHKLNLSDTLCLGKNLTFKIINTEMAGQFMVHVKIAMITGVVLSFPYLVFEAWMFVSPGLHLKERLAGRKAIISSALLFFIGIFFGYYILTPFSIDFLSTYNVSSKVENTFALTNYIDFISTMVLASGIMFQMPMAVFLLAKMGIVSATIMKNYWRYAFLISMILAAVITPPDVASMVMVGVPLFSLYLISIFIAQRINP